MTKQVRLRKLLKEERFRTYFKRPPREPDPHPTGSPAWFLYVQREKGGRWARSEHETYGDAYRALAKIGLQGIYDAAITSKRRAYGRPRFKSQLTDKPEPLDVPEGHDWCRFCRRPTVFGHFRRHHALPKNLCRPYVRRCGVCGISQQANERK